MMLYSTSGTVRESLARTAILNTIFGTPILGAPHSSAQLLTEREPLLCAQLGGATIDESLTHVWEALIVQRRITPALVRGEAKVVYIANASSSVLPDLNCLASPHLGR